MISGTGTLTKTGTGTLTLTGANTYTGGTTISAGTLQLGNGGTTGSVAGNIVDNGALVFNRSDALTYGGVISGTGTLTKTRHRHADARPATTPTRGGTTTISAGTLQIGNGGTTRQRRRQHRRQRRAHLQPQRCADLCAASSAAPARSPRPAPAR